MKYSFKTISRHDRLIYIIFFISLIFFRPVFSGEVTGKNGMVVTAHRSASEFGVDILKSGGNAIDAAVGAAIVAGVVEPNASGLGGGGTMMLYLSDLDSVTYINYYACAPQKLPENFNRGNDQSSASAVLVPGTVAGLHYALKTYGTMSWQNLLSLAVKKVKSGFKVDENLYKIILDSYEKLLLHPETKAIYLPDDLPPAEGSIIKNPELTHTLKKLAAHGPKLFYRGEIADSIVWAIKKNGGTLQKSDLQNYTVREMAPLFGTYRGHPIYSAPPPQSGSTVIEICNILEFKNLSLLGDFADHAFTLHFMAEAMKRAYADRLAYLGDPKFVDVPADILISKQFAAQRFQTINFKKAEPADPRMTEPGNLSSFMEDNDGSTTHISVVDKSGNAVSLTQTLNHFWGSGITVEGFLLNNGMTSFSETSSVNQMSPGKQPRSTIAPTLIFKEDQLFMIIGSPGAGRIISTMVEVICNIVDFGKRTDEANSAPRFASRKWADKLSLESRFSEALIDSLQHYGHALDIKNGIDMYFGGVQLIVVDRENKSYLGSSDPRRSGVALGY